jgi:hypothetical protein
MNATYTYKTGRNNITFDKEISKKGTCRPFVRKRPAYMDFAERCISFIDMIIDFFCSARVLVATKAVFAFATLLGLVGIIGGMEFGKISLLTGVICLSLIVALEFVILREDKF